MTPRNQSHPDIPHAPLAAPCACGHSRSYHRLAADRWGPCFASPMLAPPCHCPAYTTEEDPR